MSRKAKATREHLVVCLCVLPGLDAIIGHRSYPERSTSLNSQPFWTATALGYVVYPSGMRIAFQPSYRHTAQNATPIRVHASMGLGCRESKSGKSSVASTVASTNRSKANRANHHLCCCSLCACLALTPLLAIAHSQNTPHRQRAKRSGPLLP